MLNSGQPGSMMQIVPARGSHCLKVEYGYLYPTLVCCCFKGYRPDVSRADAVHVAILIIEQLALAVDVPHHVICIGIEKR